MEIRKTKNPEKEDIAMAVRTAIAAGHICIDITPVFPEGTKPVQNLGDLLKPGKLVEVAASSVHTGGSVGNTGTAMKILGADVKLLGKIGKDAFGGMIRQVLDRYGAGGDLMETEGETSSYTIVLAVPGLDRLFVHCPGANDTFSAADIPEDALESAALFHFGYPTLMRRMYENGGAELKAMFRHMKEKGIATSLDLTVPDPAGDAGKADWKGILREVLPYTDFFVPSFEELCFMLDREKYERIGKTAGNDEITKYVSLEADIIPLAEACLELGANAVLIKCGAPGMYLCCSGHMERVGQRLELDASAWNGYRAFEKSFRIDRVLSATGAGDTSIAAFLTSILKGSGPKEALENASAEGALCCTSYDSVSSLLPLEEVRKRIEEGWEKTEVNL